MEKKTPKATNLRPKMLGVKIWLNFGKKKCAAAPGFQPGAPKGDMFFFFGWNICLSKCASPNVDIVGKKEGIGGSSSTSWLMLALAPSDTFTSVPSFSFFSLGIMSKPLLSLCLKVFRTFLMGSLIFHLTSSPRF